MAMKIAEEPKAPFGIILLGASAMRECISRESELAAMIQQKTQRNLDLHLLSAGALSSVEIISLVDVVGDNFEGLIVVQIGPFHLSESKVTLGHLSEQRRLLFSTDIYNKELELIGLNPPARYSNYFFENWRFYAARLNADLVVRVINGPLKYVRHNYLDKPPTSKPKISDIMVVLSDEKHLDQYIRNRNEVKARFMRMLQRLPRDKRVDLVIIESPQHPDLKEKLLPPEVAKEHYDFMYKWGQEQHVHYLDISKKVNLQSNEFADYVHLRDEAAQKRYTEILSVELSRIVMNWKKEETK